MGTMAVRPPYEIRTGRQPSVFDITRAIIYRVFPEFDLGFEFFSLRRNDGLQFNRETLSVRPKSFSALLQQQLIIG
jgi:hypothetical protein